VMDDSIPTHPPERIMRRYDEELTRLGSMLTEMGHIVEARVGLAAEAMENGDAAAAMRVVELDPEVDKLEREVEQFVIRLLALRQPVADDLRKVVAALKITGDLERIGDYAANVAKRNILLAEYALPFGLTAMANMAKMVQQNLKTVIDAVGQGDAALAEEVWRSDRSVDELYTSIFRELITYMMEDARNITPCAHLLFIARNLERIGDHATNVAETVYYAATGENLPDARPKGETTAFSVVRPKN
jgi:phosphate transport system protein